MVIKHLHTFESRNKAFKDDNVLQVAVIRLRKIGTGRVHEFHLDGSEPSYVDMPVWYTHNITNVGEDELFTLFWINEFYDTSDPDTFYENV